VDEAGRNNNNNSQQVCNMPIGHRW